MKNFDENLKELMKQRGLNARQLSASLGVPAKTCQEWLRGRMPRDVQVIKRLSDHFGVSVHYILYGTEQDGATFDLASFLEKTTIHTGLYEITVKKVAPKGAK